MTEYERKLKKIKLNIERLALKGKENYLEFHKYVDDVVAKGDYLAFVEVLYTYFFYDITSFRSVDEMKRPAWKEILFQTTAPFLKKLKKIYVDKKVYQNSFYIYSTDLKNVSVFLSNTLTSTYSQISVTPSFTLIKDNGGYVRLNVGTVSGIPAERDNLYSFQLYSAEWKDEEGVLVPKNTTLINDVIVGEDLTFQTDLTLDTIRQYWLQVVEKQSLLRGYTYSGVFASSLAPATINWPTSATAIGYALNVSTFSNFEKTVPRYTSIGLGLASSGSYQIDGLSASLTLFELQSNKEHYFKVRNIVDTQASDFTISGTTASAFWAVDNLANSYSVDLSTYSTFKSILPGYNYIIGTVSNTPPFISGTSTNEFRFTGLTAGKYYYRVWSLHGETQSGTFSTPDSFGTASFPVVSFANQYLIDVSTSSTFSSIENSFRLGTVSGGDLVVGSTTASFKVTGLESNTLYYFRNTVLKGDYQEYNYKIDMDQDTFLGAIYEQEIYSPDVKYYLLNKQFANVIGARKTYLEVYKYDPTSVTGYATAAYFTFENRKLPEEQNLLTRYSQAIDYLNITIQ